MSNAVTVTVSDPPAASVKSFFQTTTTAFQNGIADARASAEEAWPKVADAVNKGMYNMAYGMAFGVAFPMVFVAKAIPQNNCIVWGLIDGARAARSAADRLTKKPSAEAN